MKHLSGFISKFCFALCIFAIAYAPASAQQCSPISSFSCPAVVKNLPLTLNFAGSEGGLQDKNRIATGFTMVDKPSAPLVTPTYINTPGYESSKLEIAAGKLIITTTAGISYLDPAQSAKTNSQVNALGVGFIAPTKFTVQTTVAQPNAGTGKSEQAGLWFGLDEDNFVKLVVLSSGNGNSKIEMRKEIAAMSTTTDAKSSGSMTLSSSLVRLKFLIDKVASTTEAFYSINGGAEISIGTLSIPQSFTAGKTLSDGVTGNTTFAGIFATHRSAATALTFGFEDFKIEKTEISNSDFDSIIWSKATSQPYNVNEAQGEVVNGKLYSFGGFDSRKSCCTPTRRAYVYDPVADTWSSIADLPYNPNGVNFGGVTHAGITTNGTDIFIAGGYTSNSAGTGQIFGTKQVWKYIVSQNNYIRLPDLPVSISAGQLEYLNNKLHYIGGTNSSRTADLGDHYVLDLNNIADGWKTMALLPNPRHHAGSAVYGGKLYFIGGQHAHDGSLMTQKDVHVFDPLNNSWTKVADLPVPTGATGRGHISSGVVVMGERIFVLGGEIRHGTSTKMVSAYSPATNSWQNLTPLPQTRYSGIAGAMSGNIYYFAGSNSNATYKGVPFYGTEQCSPISPFSCPAVVKNLPLTINFTGSEGGLQDKSGVATGFTMVDKPSAPLVTPTYVYTPGYEPSQLEISAGKLIITTTAGISYLNPAKSAKTNSQVNALGVGFVAPSKFTIQTILVQPNAGTGKSEQAGLWFGLDEDNYVKLVVLSTGSGTNKIEMRKEIAAISSTADGKNSGSMILSSSLVKLKFLIDKVASTIEGFYSINGGAEISIGTLSIPQSFTAGKTLSDGMTKNITFAGISATHRSAATALTFNFEDFKIEQIAVNLSFNSDSLNSVLIQRGSFSDVNASSVNMFEKPKLYPNPFQKRFNLEFRGKYTGNFTLQIIDQFGKIYDIGKGRLNPGVSNIEVNISKLFLRPGVYSLKILSYTGKTEAIKLVVL
jgi:N-acetylneuraminic acid mutarotase